MEEFDRDVLKMLYMTKRCPEVYSGKRSITRLKCYSDGFAAGYSFPSVCSFFPGFQKYIEIKYHCSLALSWNNILLSAAKDEKAALDLFFEELEAFFAKEI